MVNALEDLRVISLQMNSNLRMRYVTTGFLN